MYVITGATGNIGSKITEKLLSQGKPVRVIGRSEERLKALTGGRGEIMAGDMADSEFLTTAFTGADVVFAMIPPNMQAEDVRAHENKIGDAIAEALKESGVKRVVALSSIGAHRGDGVGIIAGLHDFEQKLNKLDNLDAIYLRPGFFMENSFQFIDMIRHMNMVSMPIEADREMPMVATQDVADTAVGFMLNPGFSGKQVHYLLGERDVTYAELTSVLGHEIGKEDLRYVKSEYDDIRNAFLGMGASESVAGEYVDLVKGFNEGRLTEDVERTREFTTRTSIEEFSKFFATVYKG